MSNTPTLLASVTVLTDQSLSEAISLDEIAESTIQTSNYRYPTGLRLFGLVMPSAWTAANITFQASFDGGATWNDIVDNLGDAHFVTPVASTYTPVDPTVFSAAPMLRLRSGTAALPVNQAAARTLTLILRSY